MKHLPPFETHTSPLHSSNDGRLMVNPADPNTLDVIDTQNETAVLTTHQRVIADAFIAGYDFAHGE